MQTWVSYLIFKIQGGVSFILYLRCILKVSSPPLPIANYLRDDEAEPDDEDDAEGEGDGGEPAGQPHAQVQAAHPLGPRSEEGKENAGTRQRTPSGGWAGIATQLDQWNKT